jgi:hypothetical protein
MTIVGTAPVPGNGYLSRLSTVELPKIRTGQPELTGPCQLDGPGLEHDMCAIGDHANCLGRRAPQGCACDCHTGAADLSESGQSAATPCPPWCVEHTTGGANPGDRSTFHEARRTEVHTRSSSGGSCPVTERHTLEVWAERFDLDEDQDGHPVIGRAAVHLSEDGTDPAGMTGEQARQLGLALLDAAEKVQAETPDPVGGRVVPLPVWPPNVCPTWCSHASDPASHLDEPLQDDRRHTHEHLAWTGDLPADIGPSEVVLSLHDRRYDPAGTMPAFLAVGLTQHYREAEPVVRLDTVNVGGRAAQMDLTVGEAAQLASLLSHMVQLATEG